MVRPVRQRINRIPVHAEITLPKVKLVQLKYKKHSSLSYQLDSGEMVMSARQVCATASQPKSHYQNFSAENELVSLDVVVPNGKTIKAWALQSSVVDYWLHLWQNDLIPKGFSKSEWLDFIKFAMTDKATEPQGMEQIQFPVFDAEAITLKLGKYQLEVLLLMQEDISEYYLSFSEGLNVIGANLNWIQQLENAPSKLATLKRIGFSGLTKRCNVKTGKSHLILETLTLKDWLIIWEFFACRGNTKAAALLRACAESNISHWLSKVISSYTIGRSVA